MLKLTSICLGPFLINPDSGKGMKIEIKLFSFTEKNIWDRAVPVKVDPLKKDKSKNGGGKTKETTHFTCQSVYDSSAGKFYTLVVFNSLVTVQDDVCIKIKSVHTPSGIESLKFRYWLNAKGIRHQVGKVSRLSIAKNLKLNQILTLHEFVNDEIDPTMHQMRDSG